MKNILKGGRVAAWVIGDQYMVVGAEDVTDAEVYAAIQAEEELERFRVVAEYN